MNLLDFDPARQAQNEARIWRLYYEKKYLSMIYSLFDSVPFKVSRLHALKMAYWSGIAVREFKKNEYSGVNFETVHSNLRKFYALLETLSDRKFDVDKVTELEVAWYVEHRENGYDKPTDKLINILQEQAQELYGVNDLAARSYAMHRAKAMCLRHAESNAGTMDPDDWKNIENILQNAWESLQS